MDHLVDDDVDIISSMPHEILHRILSFIPIKLAIRTSALSRGWRHVWCETPCLDFDNLNYYREKPTAREINQTLSFYRALKITSFKFPIPRYALGPDIDSWIEFAVSRNVEKLNLVFLGYSSYKYDFQKIFYLSSSLTELFIQDFDAFRECTVVSWKSLRKLTLWGCSFTDDGSLRNILSGSPILETLELDYSAGPQRLDLSKSHSLRRLEIRGPTEIVAPHVHYLSLETSSEGPSCTLEDVSSLTEARFHIIMNDLSCPLKLDILQPMVLKLFAKLQNVKRLTFTGPVLQILSLAELHGIHYPTFKVETLTVETRLTRSVIPGLAMLLQNSPQLKSLKASPSCLIDIENRDLYRCLESQGLNPDQCWRSKYEAFPTSDEFFRMISYHRKDETWKLMVLFMEMVMKNVKTLETLVVEWKYIESIVSHESWFEEYFLQMLPTLSNNNNVFIVFKR
ncbi:putative F-box/LRR-repeat protein At3g28410 [Raphanus sativus]|uniref:F-box/LRR-repeat protein At3g28410 n=1 Tax=Raphanus sativus TaxID=3726 RepID=A0A6J0K5K8_RAPSA|nr:putative F-box/LRR-repeat protein At3g28410 [Raphanus sativus]